MGTFSGDLRYGIRILLKSPGFSLAAIVVLALGIGANTAIFSVLNTVLLRPLPFKDPQSLVRVWHVPPQKSFPGISRFVVSAANYIDWRNQNHVFDKMAAYQAGRSTLTGGPQPESVLSATVGTDFFSVLQAQPKLGRAFSSDEGQPGHNNVAVISNAFWKNHFASNPSAIGQTLTLDAMPYTIVGVMPQSLQFASWDPTSAQVWLPLALSDKEAAARGDHNFVVVARLKPGVDLKQAQAEMTNISSRLAQQYPKDDTDWGAIVVPLGEDLTGSTRPALLVLLGAVAFVLLIACANVANLILAKSFARNKEIAIRSALGASRKRIINQVLSETVLLSLVGGLLGLLLAWFGLSFISHYLADQLPRADEIGLDLRVLAFAAAISLITGLAAGLIPALRLAQTDLNQTLKLGFGKGDSGSGGRTRSVLVVSEVALSLILLIGAGLMLRSLAALRNSNPGFDPHNVLTMTVPIPSMKYEKPAQQTEFFDNVLQRVRVLPGVVSAATIDGLPLVGGSIQPVVIEGRAAEVFAVQPEIPVRRISTGYLRTMRTRLLQGRDFSEADRAGTPTVALISQAMATRFWPNENPIGKHFTLSFSPEASREVVGVVENAKLQGLDADNQLDAIYIPEAQNGNGFAFLTVRTSLPPADLAPAVIKAIQQVDPDQAVQDVLTMDDVASNSIFQQRFSAALLASFASLALLLAAVGIYSVLAYAVGRRVREIGVRMALGAQMTAVLRMVLFDGMKPTLIGIAIGLAGALALGRIVANQIYGVKPTDPLTFAVVSILLTAVALVASIIPAYRAARIDPMRALRDE